MVLMSYYMHSLLFRCYYPNNLLLSLAMQIKVIGTQSNFVNTSTNPFSIPWVQYKCGPLSIYSICSELADINDHVLTIIPTN